MNYILHNYKPEALFKFFEEISAIPRSSGNEEALSDYLMEFAHKQGLEAYRDNLWNVIIRKPGSSGCEALPPVMLQGHTDMVCEKNASTLHDFSKDRLFLLEEKGILRARGTTLGADNGIAVALMMALLSDPHLIHPPLECVFTTQEETGLKGAAGLDASQLHGRTMINLDSEEEDIATISCAGGRVLQLFYPLNAPGEEKSRPAFRVFVTGLQGGHSGTDIHLDRGNANLVMGRLLQRGGENRELFLVSLKGGAKDNAIPRECEAVVYAENSQSRNDALAALRGEAELLRQEYSAQEPGLEISLESLDHCAPGDREAFVAARDLLILAPNGVQSRNLSAGGFTVCSTNLGVIRTEEGQLTFTFSLRSSVASLMEALSRKVRRLGTLLGFSILEEEGYPGWAYQETSQIRETFRHCYKTLFGQELRCEAIHAGLECGLFVDKLPGLDAIAVGPDIRNCHTPEEFLDLASCERTYNLLTTVLKELAGTSGK